MQIILENNELNAIKSVEYSIGRKQGYSEAMDIVIGVLKGRTGLSHNGLSPKNREALDLLYEAKAALDKIR